MSKLRLRQSRQPLLTTWIFGLLFGLAFSTGNSAWSQTTLERLESQIRQRVGSEPQPPPPGIPAPDSALRSAEPVSAAEGKQAGYLGLLADDRQDRGRGVRVLDVYADGPAAKGGLKKGDLITGVSGVRTRQMSEMADVLNLYAPGESVEFDLLRDNKPQKVKVVLGSRPATKNPAAQTAEAIPLPPGEIIPDEPPQEPSPGSVRPDGAKNPSLLELFKPKSPTAGEKKVGEPDAVAPPLLFPPRAAETEAHPTVEQLQKRIVELERRVAELEKKLAETKKPIE
jgi:hypothetical protein